MILSFGSVIISLLAFVFALGLIILVHEGGHFFFARRANILCREYAFGMGPQLWKKKKGETEYSIRALPIGGFCAIAGEELEQNPLTQVEEVKLLIEEGKVTKFILEDKDNIFDDLKSYKIVKQDIFDEEDTGHLYITVLDGENEIEYTVHPQAMFVFIKKVKNPSLTKEQKIKKYTQEIQIAPHNRTLNAKTKRQRAMVMFGGPLMNFLLAIVVFFIGSMFTGFSDTSSTKLAEVGESTPAYVANLQKDDVILELSTVTDNGVVVCHHLNDWNGISKFMDEYKSRTDCNGDILVKYSRDGVESTTSISPMVVIYSISLVQDVTDKTNVKIAALAEQSLAYQGGLREGDIITAIKYASETSDKYVSVSTWKDVYTLFTANVNGDLMTVKVLRNGETVECEVDPYSKELFDKTQSVDITAMVMGISPQTKFHLGKSFIYSFTELYASLENMINTLGLLFFSDEVGIKQLSGPVGIFTMTSNAASAGFGSLLNFIGFLSVNIGFMNLLPIPALDGGRLVFVAYEAITKKKPSEKLQTALITVTMILLLGLILFVSFNDVLRLLGGF